MLSTHGAETHTHTHRSRDREREGEPGEPQTGQGHEFRQLHSVFEERMQRFTLRLANAGS